MAISYYDIGNILKEKADIYIIYGERSNGKSYQVKNIVALDEFIKSYNKYKETNKIEDLKRFFLIRRLEAEIKNSYVEKYFADCDIRKLTNGEYDCIDVYRKEIFFAKIDDKTRKPKRGIKIGYVGSLSTEQNYAMQSYLDVKIIIFEEFMTRSIYLSNEPSKLMNFFSTIDRKRHVVKMFLVGNTISRINPYLRDWDLMDIMRKQKQGEIVSCYVGTGDFENGEEVKIKIAIEYCKPTGTSSYVIGKHANMLNKGEWQSDPQPSLNKSYNDYSVIYRIGFIYKEFKFLGELLKDKETKELLWFIKPYKYEFKKDILIFSDIIKENKNYQRNIYDITIKNDKLQSLLNTFREGNIFYASDLIGTDFKQAIDFNIRR